MKPKNSRKPRNVTDYSPLVQQKWSFLSKASLAIPDKACENMCVMQSIHDMEEKTMDERVLDQYELMLVDMIKTKEAGKSIPMPEEATISFDAIKELSISLNTVRQFAKEKHLKDAKKAAAILPHLHNKSLDHGSVSSELDGTEELEDEDQPSELSELDRVIMSHRYKTPKKRHEVRESFDSNPTYVDQANHDDKIAKALIKSRAKISRQLAENIRNQIGEVQQQIVKTTIARKFRNFTVDNGYRLPTCLEGLPPNPVEKPSVFGNLSGKNNISSPSNNNNSSYLNAFRRNSEFSQVSNSKQGSSSNGSNSILKPVAPPVAEKSSRGNGRKEKITKQQ